MLTQLEVFTPRVVTPPFSFNEAGAVATDPIQITNIDGLGPVPAAVSSTPFGSIDGEVFNGAVVGKRVIAISYRFNPDYAGEQSVATLRQALYAYFMPKNHVTLRFINSHMADCQIEGVVESMEPNIFSPEPEIVVTIVCVYPYFTDLAVTSVSGSAIAIDGTDVTTIDYAGTVPSGFVIRIEKDASNYTGQIKVQMIGVDTETFNAPSGIVIDGTYDFEVSTVLGDKYAEKVNRSTGARTNVLGLVSTISEWPQIYQGLQTISVQAATPSQHWTLEYFNRYGGL